MPDRPAEMTEIRRILVALDPAFAQSLTPELAIKVAAGISAEIDALLVQDSALMTAADLPFAQEILAPTGARRGLTREALDLDFEIVQRQLERRFEQLAGRAGLRWNVRSVRGDPIPQIIAAAAGSDLFILGLARGMALSVDAMRRIAREARRPAVFLGDLASPTGDISVFDGEAELLRDLPAVAGLLARAFPGALKFCSRPAAAEIEELRRRAVLVLPSGGGPELP